MLYAAQNQGDKLLQLCLGYWGKEQASAIQSKPGGTALFHAIQNMDGELLNKFFKSGMKATEEDGHLTSTLLLQITQKNDIHAGSFICDLIREDRFQTNPLLYKDQFGNTALHYAAQLGRTDLCNIYVNAFTRKERDIMLSPNSQGQTPLDFAKISREEQIVALLAQYA